VGATYHKPNDVFLVHIYHVQLSGSQPAINVYGVPQRPITTTTAFT